MASMFTAIYSFLSFGNILLLLLLLFILHYLLVLCDFRDMPPGPRLTTLPILGNLFSLDYKAEKLTDAFQSLTQNYGRVFSLRIGGYKVVMATTLEAVKEVLVKRSADYSGRPKTYRLFQATLGGKDIAFGNGPAWKFHRKLFMTALRQYLLDIPLIESRISTQAEKLLQFIGKQDGNPFNPSDCLMRCIADVICGITFGEGFDTSIPELNKLLQLNIAFNENAHDLQMATLLDFFPLAKYLPLKAYDRYFQPLFHNFKVIRKFLQERKENFNPHQPVKDLISGLLYAKHEALCENDEETASFLSDDYFLNSIQDMFFAGYETTGTTIKWAIAFLVNYPKYQEDIQSQIDEEVGERRPFLNDRSRLPLLQATIMETLRLGNVFPIALPHVTLADTTLCGYRIPKNAVVVPNLESVHLDPNCWANPIDFNPYRHIAKDGKLITNQGYLFPFGAGRRVCAGEALAKVELFLFLSWMLQTFTFVAEEDGCLPNLESVFNGFIKSPSAYKIRAIKRK